MDTFELLRQLCEQDFIGGLQDAAGTVEQQLRPYVDQVERLPDGSVLGRLGDDGPGTLLEAHIDQVGLVVTQVYDDGFLSVAKCGGPDIRALPAASVTIHGRKNLPGVFYSTPPHLRKREDDALPELDKLYIDTGLGKQAKELIAPGDYVTYDTRPVLLKNGMVSARSLDDRAACAALILAAQQLHKQPPASRVLFAFCSGEELGSRGAITTAFAAEANRAVAVDVSFGQSPGVPEHRCGVLGKGPMIGVSPVLSGRVTAGLQAVCEERQITCQTEVMGGSTSTDADVIALSKQGIACGLVSIPLRYMHTPVECVQLRDVELTAILLAEYVRKAGQEHD